MVFLIINPNFQYRLEYFGSLLRNKKTGQVYKLGKINTLVLLMYQVSRCQDIVQSGYKSFSKDFGISCTQFNEAVEDLVSQGIIVPTNNHPISLLEDVPQIKKHFEENSPKKNIIKPFWSHLQPFTRCNQRCIQ